MTTQEHPGFRAAAQRVRDVMATGMGLPDDPAFYAEVVTVANNWGQPRALAAADLVKGVSFARYFERNGISQATVTRFIAERDSMAIAMELTGRKPDGTPTRFTIATFLRFEAGRIVEIEEWYDRSERDQRTYGA